MRRYRRVCASVLAVALVSQLVLSHPVAVGAAGYGAGIAYHLSLPQGRTAIVFSNGIAQVYSKDKKQVETRLIPLTEPLGQPPSNSRLPSKAELIAMLAKGPAQPYAPGELVVVYRAGVAPSQDTIVVDQNTLTSMRTAVAHHQAPTAVPSYTNDFTTNRALAALGVDRSDRLFKQFARSALQTMRTAVSAETLDFSSAYRLHLSGSSVYHAVVTLSKLPTIAYVSPDFTVEPAHTPAVHLNPQAAQEARARAQSLSMPRSTLSSAAPLIPAKVPSNYASESSLQSMLNSPSDDAMAAFDEIGRHFNQIPGQGETITDVSIGDLDDASAASNTSDPCNFWVSVYGPTTEIIGGQRYINMPSMPLIPTFTADDSGNLNGTGEVCGLDPQLTEVGLDFSMMAPLPHSLQRPGEVGSGLTDLLGIAPGAQFRLVVPASFNPTFTDIDGAILGAALQSPRTNVITITLGFGEDEYGFPSRYLEDDPLSEAIITAIVRSYNIVVSVAANDGTRTFTTVAIGPSGGSAPTEVIPNGGTPTALSDIAFSTVPSRDFDSGSTDAGGTTLDDIFSTPPQYASGEAKAQHAYAETRWTGFTSFSSGFGSRVNASAPSDNVIGFEHSFGGTDDAVDVVIIGGTSASAPEIGAASAVLLQVARLTGHPFANPDSLRAFIQSSSTDIPNVSQADTNLHVGPQINVRKGVEALLVKAGVHDNPSVPRVGIEQRRGLGDLDGVFQSDTDPSDIDLQNGYVYGAGSDQDVYAWITIAPDWESIPLGAKYALKVKGTSNVLATTPWARLLPGAILKAAGLPLVSSSTRTVNLTYEAQYGAKSVSTTFSLTFGPADATSFQVLAPRVAPVTTGSTIAVTYDLTAARDVSSPELLVSEPGRVNPATGPLYHPVLTIPLSALKGTVNVPVSALQGGGIYGLGILFNPSAFLYSDFAYTRVQPQESTDKRPAAPELSSNGSAASHDLEIPYGASFQVAYDVRNVPGATGAMVEVSAAGPTAWGIWNPFNNPNGTIRDNNGIDTGSEYFAPVSGTSGVVTLNGKTIGLDPAMNQVVRVIPMKFGVAAGEGSDVSSVMMDGVAAADGGFVNNGFGVNGNGLDGFITSGQETSSGQILTSLETFDQTDNAIVQNVASATNALYFTNGWGIWGNDIGLFGLFNESTGLSNYNLLDPVALGNIGIAWTPPFPQSTFFITEGAANQVNDLAAFQGYDAAAPTNQGYRVFTSNLTKNTFSPAYNVSGPIENFNLPSTFGFAENTKTETGYMTATDFLPADGNICNHPPTIVTVNLKNGSVGSFAGLGTGFPYGIAIDSGTDKAAIPVICSGAMGVYNLATKTGTTVTLPGELNGFYTANDSPHSLFLVEQTTNADFGENNNSLSTVLVYDESGNLQKQIEKFNLFNDFLIINANNLQLNGARRTGYLIGPGEQQLQPFNY